MSINRKSQSIVITGGSGSGKSFTAKYLTQFLYQGEITEFAARVNTILESFGNCETEQNDNSSRFVKLLKVIFLLFVIILFFRIQHFWKFLNFSYILLVNICKIFTFPINFSRKVDCQCIVTHPERISMCFIH